MSQLIDFALPEEEEKAERIAERIAFCAELIWEVAPKSRVRAKRKNILAENAENYYERNKQKFSDDPSQMELGISSGADWWIRSSYIVGYWSDIKDYLAMTGRAISYTRKGCYRTNDIRDISELHERRVKAIKKQGERMTYRAILFNKATDTELPGAVIQFLQLPAD